MDAWPEDAQRRVTALEKELEACRAERAHYVGIVEAHEYDWMLDESLSAQVEALGIANAELEIECAKLRSELAAHRNSAPLVPVGPNREPPRSLESVAQAW